MHEDSVLRCGQCNKPFDKRSTLKRHGYYCRSRRAGAAPRPRSCIACAKGKAGCDNRRPRCSRCITKDLECHYPVSKARATGPRTQRVGDAPSVQEDITPPSVAGAESHQEASNNGDLFVDGGLVISGSDLTNFEEDYLDWERTDMSFADFLNPQASEPYLSPASPIRGQQGPSIPKLWMPTVPSGTVRSLVQRPRRHPGSQRIANLILHTLKSYPLMMLHRSTLPPFVHPTFVTSEFEDAEMEPLTNCISLVHMISNRVLGSRKLFWRNVRTECERFSEEHSNFRKWKLLAAMQALSIYVLIRLHEGETDHNNIDFQLVTAVTIIAQELTNSDATCPMQCTLCNSGLEMSWREWVFRESRRRLGVVYRIMNMLIYFEPVTMCYLPTDLILAPLPARKQLWEAGDQFSWRSESLKEPGIQTCFGLAADGELVKLDDDQLSCSDSCLPRQSADSKGRPRRTVEWEEWCSGMDGFGGLVMLAASLTA